MMRTSSLGMTGLATLLATSLAALFLFSVSIFAEAGYEGDLTQSDLRRKDLILLIKKNQIPAALKLRYSGKSGDYLVFYDYVGLSIFFKYREDRFDRDAENKVRELIEGEAYEIKGAYLGQHWMQQLWLKDRPEFQKSMDSVDSVPVFQYDSARSLRLDQVMF